jgi:Uma2 family endonuclease
MMATLSKSRRPREPLPPLENGDRLDQMTFHARYEAMPEGTQAELIGGIVYMGSPQKRPHGRSHSGLSHWLLEYELETPGTELQSHATSILGPESEPQPDSALFILPECGGRVWEDEAGYLKGAPELVAEVASATESIDLHAKKADYEKAGVREYLVLALRRQEVFWFVRRRGKFRELAAGSDGILRSEIFPGLWLDAAALLRHDRRHLLSVLRQGLATPEHLAFVARLTRK